MDLFLKIMMVSFFIGVVFPFIIRERGRGAIVMFGICFTGIIIWQITEVTTIAFIPLAFAIGNSFGFPIYRSYMKYRVVKQISNQLQLF